MTGKELLQSKIRLVTEEDEKNLTKYSYSGLSAYKQCPYQFNLKYNEKLTSTDTTLALELGTLLHYVLEQKGKMLTDEEYVYPNGCKSKGIVNYNVLSGILQKGTTNTDEKTKEKILGLNELKRKYWEAWGIPDSEGRTYDEKINLFLKVLTDEMENTAWHPYLFEHPFEFVYDNKIILHGFIDRVDKKEDGSYRVVDYKTNKKLYDSKDLVTSLQFGIYALAILNEFGELPREYQYRMILLDDRQTALTLGWEKRLVTALDKIIKGLDERKVNGEWEPKPTPLCHWCNYSGTNPDAKQYKGVCPYYSLWTPEAKTFEVNHKYELNNLLSNSSKNDNNSNKGLQTKRNVIF